MTNQILADAVGVIERYGHAKGTLGSCKEGFCAVGAVLHAMDPQWRKSGTSLDSANDAMDLLRAQLFEDGVPPEECATEVEWVSIPGWNNNPATTVEDVILAMKKAAHRDS
jgi:hypothetical protein